MRMALAALSTIALFVLIVLRFVFAGLHRRSRAGAIAAPHRQWNRVLERYAYILGRAVIADNGFENSSDDVDANSRNVRAQTYLRRVVALTGATQIGNRYVLDFGRTRLHVHEGCVGHPKCEYERTCFCLPYNSMPKAEQIASALLQLRNNPALFDRWAARSGAFKADGQGSAVRSDQLAMKMQTRCSPAHRAAKYLKRVAVLTGAEQVSDDSYWLRAGRKNLLVDSKLVRVISHHGTSTCFSVATDPDIPSAEIVASALLQLKSNPRLFKKWRKQPGRTFKANGKMFRDLYQLTRDET
jgi:hypothetical protein